MSRRRKKYQQASQPTKLTEENTAGAEKTPWHKHFWVIASGFCAIVAAILINGPDALRNARVLPSEVSKTISQFHSWIKEDSEWTGKWTAHPEGFIDLEEMQLSSVDMEIIIWATEGQIAGTIATKRLCKELPMFNYILLEGSVSGNSAKVTAWDFIGGQRVEFAQLILKRTDHLMTVTPANGNKEWFPATSHIAREPSSSEESEKPEPDHTFCAAEREELFNSLRGPNDLRGSSN